MKVGFLAHRVQPVGSFPLSACTSCVQIAGRNASFLRSSAQITRAFLFATATIARFVPRRSLRVLTHALNGQDALHLTDRRGPVVHEPLPRAMQRLDVLLLDRLLGTKRMFGCRRAVQIASASVVLLGLEQRLHILRCDDPPLVAERLEATLPDDRARAGLDADRAWRQASDDGEQVLPPDPALKNASAVRVGAIELEHVLRQVDPERLDGHRSSLLCSDVPASPVGGRAVHPITWKAKYGGRDVSDAKRLRALEDENAKRKRLYADAMLDSEPCRAIGPSDNGDLVAPLVRATMATLSRHWSERQWRTG